MLLGLTLLCVALSQQLILLSSEVTVETRSPVTGCDLQRRQPKAAAESAVLSRMSRVCLQASAIKTLAGAIYPLLAIENLCEALPCQRLDGILSSPLVSIWSHTRT